MIRFLYNLFFPVGLLFFLPAYLVKMQRRGNYCEKFGQRLGIYDDRLRTRLSRRSVTWIHAVSVGEVAVGLKLAARLKELDPNFFCVLTTTTATGFAFAAKESQDWIEVMYNPLDFWPVMRRAFKIIRPVRIILVEAEIWPNLVAEAHARSIPIALVNARLSPRSERRFRKFRFFVAPVFRQLDLVCVPETEDVARWSALGVLESRIRRTGNIKYDIEQTKKDEQGPRDILNSIAVDPERPVIFGGSTHAGEEIILAQIFLQLRAEFPALFLIIAPRHAERARRVRLHLEQLSLRVGMRSAMNSTQPDHDRIRGKKPHSAWRPKSGRTDHGWQAGDFRPAHGKLCAACASAHCASRRNSSRERGFITKQDGRITSRCGRTETPRCQCHQSFVGPPWRDSVDRLGGYGVEKLTLIPGSAWIRKSLATWERSSDIERPLRPYRPVA